MLGKSSRRVILRLVIFAVLMSACNDKSALPIEPTSQNAVATTMSVPSPTETSQDPCVLVPPWSLSFFYEGGIAGIRQYIVLNDNGELAATDEKLNAHIEKNIPAEEIEEIALLFYEACASEQDAATEDTCFDCLVRRLEITSQDLNMEILRNDISLRGSSFQPLFDKLAILLASALMNQK